VFEIVKIEMCDYEGKLKRLGFKIVRE